MLKGKKVIIFDMDGTLIDSIGIWNEIDKELIKAIWNGNIDNIDIGKQRDEKLKEYSRCEDAYLEYCKFLKQKYGSNMEIADIKNLRYHIADNYLRESIDYKPEVEKVLKYLKQKSFILVIASTTNDNTIGIYKKHNRNIINKANIEDIFSLVYSKGAVKELKPNPEIYYKILKELNVTADECLIIEDSLIGVEAGNNANIEVAVIYDKYSDCNRKEINKLSQYQFKDYNEMLTYMKNELDGLNFS